ncbi:hypothetical protein GCM10010170_024560 [Dactylosporangium salmoneum]|uniref:RHS repeat-associated protein n=1 Tax=Dactylosporangium salmoneum TaxID=53361 RepID=A0ABN3FZW7_9ACTN
MSVRSLLHAGCSGRLAVIATGAVASFVVSMAVNVPAHAAPNPADGKAAAAPDTSTPVSEIAVKAPTKSDSADATLKPVPAAAWPLAGTADSTLSAEAIAPGGLPVEVLIDGSGDNAPRTQGEIRAAGAAVPMRVAVADQAATQAAGVHGVLLQVSRADGEASLAKAGLSINYSKFATAYGANYGARLQLVSLPSCVLNTPSLPECQTQTPIMSTNDPATQTVTAQTLTVGAEPMVMALSTPSNGSSAEANWTATDLSPAYSWASGTGGGAFTLSYPIQAPASLGGPAPQLALAYSSGSVDAKTASKTGQSSVVGEGWDLTGGGYVERAFRMCADDGSTTADACWFSAEEVTLVLGGRSVKLIKDANGWHAIQDDKLKIEDLTDSSAAHNSAQNGEYWKVTTQDGTQYYFGKMHRYVGDTAGGAKGTGSVLSEPVIGNQAADPCHGNPNSWCFQTYRWNLDYVVDPRGNSMTYFYDILIARYGFLNNLQALDIDLSSRLNRIEYGTRAGSEATGAAPMQVVFDYAERCFNNCSWPSSGYADTPTDLYCDLTATSCPNATAPVHFTRYRLAAIRTQVYTGSTYRNVDRWNLDQTFLTSGDSNGDGHDDTAPNLALSGLVHTGFAANGVTAQTEPAVTFGYINKANRTDWSAAAGTAPFIHWRLSQINNGVGGQTLVHYLDPDCVNGGLKINGDSNPFRCFPQYIKPPSAPAGFAYFNKYVVDSVTERDLTGGSPDEVTSYAYSTDGSSDTALWAHDDVDMANIAQTSWGDWRGYPTVTTTHGTVAGQQTVTKVVYHRGLTGDAKKSGDDTQVLYGVRPAFTLEPLQSGAGNPVGLAGGGTAGTGAPCVDILNAVNADGTALQAYPCNGLWQQQWVRRMDSSGRPTLQNPASTKCVDIKGGGTANGTQVWLYTCNNTAAQVWMRQPDGQLKNPATGRCLDVSGSPTQPGHTMQIWDCAGSWHQVYMPTAKNELVITQAVRCTGLSGTADGSGLQSQVCGMPDTTANQTWQLQRDGSIVNPGTAKCMTVQNSGTANNTPVVVSTCNQSASQQWTAQTDGTLRNPNSGRCLDAEGDNGLYIYDCSARLSQLWLGRSQDNSAFTSQTRVSYTLDNGAVSSLTSHRYSNWVTASRAAFANPAATLNSQMARETFTKAATWIAATSSWLWTETDTTYDTYGDPTDVKDWGELGNPADDACTRTDYARNTAAYLVSYPAQVVTTDCAATPQGANFLSGSQFLYDSGTSVGGSPTQGLVTQSNAMADVTGTNITWAKQGRTTYDQYGRVQDTFDALEHKTMTRYTPSVGGPTTSLAVTNPLQQTRTTTIEPGHGVATAILDPNNQTTAAEYDPLGRLAKIWEPGRSTSLTPNVEYAYTLANTTPNVVTSKKLGPTGNVITTTTLYDGQLRTRQKQESAPQAKGGRTITDVQYDGRGLPWQQTTFWESATAPAASLAGFSNPNVKQQARIAYDGLERPIASGLYAADSLKWQTTVTYDGNSATLFPPSGGTPKRTTYDADGNAVEDRQFTSGSLTGPSQATTYQYDRLGRLVETIDSDGNQWTATYDRLGRRIGTTDPDKGATTSVYDAADRLTATTDARGITLAYSYDDLDRKTGLFEGTTSGQQRAAWQYDTVRKGALTRATRYVGGVTYAISVDDYDAIGQPLSISTTLPIAAGIPAGTYTATATYNVDGSVATTTYPAAGGLPSETVARTYDSTGRLLSLTGLETYVADTAYYGFGAMYQQVLGAAGKRVRRTATIDETTGRLTDSITETQNQVDPSAWDERLNESYTFDDIGDITAITERSNGSVVANECFKYDGMQELTEAWTVATASCPAAPSQGVIGGADPYWTSYQYRTATGNRISETKHASSGNTTRTYTYPTAGANSIRPHAISKVDSTGATISSDTYSYDNAGNVTTRAIAGGPNQALTWDAEGHLDTVTDSTGTTRYTYDADGERLVASDSQGTTVFLPGFDLRTHGSTTTVTRYYADLAVRTSVTALSWMSIDHHGTGTLAIDSVSLAATRRRLDPYGNPRSNVAVAWPSDRGFLNGTQDSTGLTHLGAREYEPTTGRFISVDPLLDVTDPLAIGGYGYSDNNPVTKSDPTGLYTDSIAGPIVSMINVVKAIARAAINTLKRVAASKGGIAKAASRLLYNATNMAAKAAKTAVTATSDAAVGVAKAGVNLLKSVAADPLGTVDRLLGGGTNSSFAEINRTDLAAADAAKARAESAKSEALVEQDRGTAGLGAKETTSDGSKPRTQPVSAGGSEASQEDECEHSFDPDTAILLADGRTRAIKDVQVNDTVLAVDHNGVAEPKPVVALHVNIDVEMANVEVEDSAGHAAVLQTTDNHPFWSDSRNTWIEAKDLLPSERLRSTGGDDPVRVRSVAHHSGPREMRDLTVADDHTYFVLAGSTPVLVHNCSNRKHDKARGAEGVRVITEDLVRWGIQSRDIWSEAWNNGFKIDTPTGVREVDIALRLDDGSLLLLEVKTGKSNYTRDQRDKDEWLFNTYGFRTIVVRSPTECPICFPRFP